MNKKIKRIFSIILAVTTIAIALIPTLPTVAALAEEQQYVFTSIDKPGAYSTNAMGINARGDIVGVYDNPGDARWIYRGFLFSKGIYTEIDYPDPDAIMTFPVGISPSGDIVGYYYEDTNGDGNTDYTHGFLRTKEGAYSKVDYEDPLVQGLTRILPDGTMIGMTYTMHPIMISGKTYTERADILGCHYGATPNGKQLVGTYYNPFPRAYLIDNGTFIPFDVFDGIISVAWGISPSGNTIVGTYKHTPSYDYFEGHGFIAERKGLDVEDWNFTEVVYPDATVIATRIFGINAGGDIVGAYNHSDGIWHGFVATPFED